MDDSIDLQEKFEVIFRQLHELEKEKRKHQLELTLVVSHAEELTSKIDQESKLALACKERTIEAEKQQGLNCKLRDEWKRKLERGLLQLQTLSTEKEVHHEAVCVQSEKLLQQINQLKCEREERKVKMDLWLETLHSKYAPYRELKELEARFNELHKASNSMDSDHENEIELLKKEVANLELKKQSLIANSNEFIEDKMDHEDDNGPEEMVLESSDPKLVQEQSSSSLSVVLPQIETLMNFAEQAASQQLCETCVQQRSMC